MSEWMSESMSDIDFAIALLTERNSRLGNWDRTLFWYTSKRPNLKPVQEKDFKSSLEHDKISKTSKHPLYERSMWTASMEARRGRDTDHLLPSRLQAPSLLAPPKVWCSCWFFWLFKSYICTFDSTKSLTACIWSCFCWYLWLFWKLYPSVCHYGLILKCDRSSDVSVIMLIEISLFTCEEG